MKMRQLHERTGRSEEEDNLKKKKEGFGNGGRKEEEDEDAAVADEWLVGICVCLKNIRVRQNDRHVVYFKYI